jgi:hypothetical protein
MSNQIETQNKLFTGSIQYCHTSNSEKFLEDLNPEEIFGVKPLKWEVGTDSVDVGGQYGADQDFTWVKFAFRNDVTVRLNELKDKYQDYDLIIEIDEL